MKIEKAKKYGHLTCLKRKELGADTGEAVWECRCDCGREVAVRVTMLTAGRTQSCGCYQREMLGKGRRFAAGTCLEIIASEKIPKNNTSGCRGVSWSRGAWIAYINYAGKHYHLGRYPRYQDAVKVRQGAEALRLKYAKERADAEKEGSGGAMPEFGERLETLLNEIHAGIDGQAEKNPT